MSDPAATAFTNIPYQFIGMLPYVLTIVVVAGAMGRSIAPAAVGRPYKKQ